MARNAIPLLLLMGAAVPYVGAWIPPTRRTIRPFITSHHASVDSAEEEIANPLISAGNHFKGIDEDVGSAMCRAGVAWSSDWSQVAEALDEASTAFWDVLSKKNISPKLQNICRSVAQELEDISTIEGCSSVGPVASVPNWITIHQYLEAAAAAYEGDQEDQKIYNILKKCSLEVEALIESI